MFALRRHRLRKMKTSTSHVDSAVSLLFLLVPLVVLSSNQVEGAPSLSDGLVQNITRLDKGDVFFVSGGGECGVTRCGEVSGGTALSERPPGGYGNCPCRCRGGFPLFREDKVMCVAQISECPMTQFGAGESAVQVPMVFLPLPGQIIHPSKEIQFADVNKTACAVSSAQYLTRTGWGSLREELDNDVPFSLYRDEGRTYLTWRGSDSMRARVTGRIVVVRLACRSDRHVVLPCVAFRIQGTSPDLPNEIPAVYFSRDELFPPPPRSHAASLSTTLLLCALVGTLIYAGALVLYMRNKRRRLLAIDNDKADEQRIPDLSNPTTNPLLSLSSFFTESRTSSCEMFTDKEDSSRSFTSRSSSMTDSLNKPNSQNEQSDDQGPGEETDSEVCATIHHISRAKSTMGLCVPVLVEKRPEIHVNIVEDPDPVCRLDKLTCQVPPSGNIRKKLYFNPTFLEPNFLKHPPPAAVEFLTKIREVIAVAKDKMFSKKFIPCLPSITEERLCYEVELTLNDEHFRSRNTTFSLKRENSRRNKNCCSGCPGCKNVKIHDILRKTLSEKEFCKSCASSDTKEVTVRKWLDKIPIIETIGETGGVTESTTSQVKGVPEPIKPKYLEEDTNSRRRTSVEIILIEVKDKDQPPPPPVRSSSISNKSDTNIKEKEDESGNKPITRKRDEDILNIPISPELKKKMNAVIDELTKYRRIEPIVPRIPSPVTEVATPFIPKLIIPIIPKVIINGENKKSFNGRKCDYETDSLERTNLQRRATTSNIQFLPEPNEDNPKSNHKRRASIIPMDKLEPMKKIQEMNSRLSRNFSIPKEKDSNKVPDGGIKCKSYTIQRSNLVSEVYINDFVNTMSSTSDSEYSSPTSSIIQIGDSLNNTPSHLVIEVESTPETKSFAEDQYFDPDTLDRKPSTGRFLRGPIVKPKNIDHIFLKSPSSFKEDALRNGEADSKNEYEKGNYLDNSNSNNFYGSNLKYSKTIDNNFIVNRDNVTYYENCIFSNFNNVLNSGSRSLSEIFLEKREEIKPPLPPKKTVGKNRSNMWINESNNTSKVLLNVNGFSNDKPSELNNNTYRITRSEPPQINTYIDTEDKSVYHRPLIVSSQSQKPNIRNYTPVEINRDKNNLITDAVEYISIDPNYDYYSTFEFNKTDKKQELPSTTDQKTNDQAVRKQNKRSSKYRNKLVTKHSKTEDSGYLSSDSNESRKKSKFILQVRDKDGAGKDAASDTDDLESIGDARSESGAESIETNSVFFGSLRTLSSIRKAQEEKITNGFGDVSKSDGLMKSAEDCKETRNVVTITSPRERLAALDDL